MSFRRLGERVRDIVVPTIIVNDAETLSFVEFVKRVRPTFVWYRHCRVIASALERSLEEDGPRRIMIFVPVRHGKSELASRLWPAYLAYRFPREEVGITSYSASLAKSLCADARGNYLQIGGKLDPSTRAKHDWRTVEGGRVWAEGVGGSLTGKGFKFGICDDPIKGAKESQSETTKRTLREWYQSVFYTRQAPDARIYIIQTRWAEDDLSGWQLAEERAESEDADGTPERWHIINLQALRDFDDESEFPATCTVEPDWRRHGEALCPERYGIEKLRKFARRLGDYFWAALFQQKPIPKGGGIFKSYWFDRRVHINDLPKMAVMVVGVDLAYKEKDLADWTVAFPFGRDDRGNYYLFRPYRAQAEAGDALDGIAIRAREVRAQAIGVEEVAAQSAYVSLLRNRRDLSGMTVVGVAVSGKGDKVTRALGWAPLAQAKLITLVADGTGWEDLFVAEATSFPNGAKKDQVDAVGIAIEMMRTIVQDPRIMVATDGRTEEVRKGLR